MKVYILIIWRDRDRKDIGGVFSNRKAAENALRNSFDDGIWWANVIEKVVEK